MTEGDLLNELDEDTDPVGFWERKQRELITSTVDYNLSTLTNLIQEDQINLNPHYQRRLRWTPEKKSRLIESFLLNVPVPPVFFNEDDIGSYSVIDGKQRLSSIYEYFAGAFSLTGLKVFGELNGVRFNKLPGALQNALRTRSTIRAVVILRQSDRDLKYEIFDRLNTGGAALNAQEIRNNTFHGPFNDMLMKASEIPRFHEMLGIRGSKSPLYLNMRDAELVLRYFTFRRSWRTFEGGMKKAMDDHMKVNRQITENDASALNKEFQAAIGNVYQVFGKNSFRRWLPEKGAWGPQIVASVFDAQMFSLGEMPPEKIDKHEGAILDEFKKLFENKAFLDKIDAATNTPSFFRDRVRIARELVDRVAK